MTIIGDVIPAIMASSVLATAASTASAAGGTAAAFGTGLTAAQLGALGFTSGVVGAGGIASAGAGAGAGLGTSLFAGLGAKELFTGVSATGSLLSGASSLMTTDDGNKQAKKELANLQANEKPDVAGDNHLKKLKAMVAGRNKLKTTSGSKGLLSTASDDQKLGNA